MDWFSFCEPKTKREVQTHLREFLAYNQLNSHIEEPYMLVNTYIRDIEKPESILHLFQPPSHELLCEMYSFIQKELQSDSIASFLKMMGKEYVPNIQRKEVMATPKQIKYAFKLCRDNGIKIDLESLSFKECSQMIKRLVAYSELNKTATSPA